MRTSDTGPTRHDEVAANETSIARVVAAVVISSLLTLGVPEGMHLAALSALLFIAAVIAGMAALFGEDDPLAPTLTRWDEATALMTLSLLLGWLGGVGGIDAAGQ